MIDHTTTIRCDRCGALGSVLDGRKTRNELNEIRDIMAETRGWFHHGDQDYCKVCVRMNKKSSLLRWKRGVQEPRV